LSAGKQNLRRGGLAFPADRLAKEPVAAISKDWFDGFLEDLADKFGGA
jgi:hypothetical protein